ncbi:MAG TPA: condensation domain-containing protein, partial [Chthonomonadaceae bacterium]|nr:condensation domain-containing protein [Chthonomonadaceae bacterium]
MPVIPPQRKKISPEILRKLAQAELGIYQTTTPIRRRAQSVAPLSYPQVRVWFIDQLEPESTVYIIPLAWRFRGDLDKAALQTAVNEIIRRHEALRTTFAFVEGAPLQRIHAPSPLPLQVVDLQSLAPEQREKEALRQLQEASRRPFDLRQGPVFRAALFQLAVEEHLFLLTMHHIVSDGWSQGILLRELAILYNAFRAGKSSPLPELPVQYADYALWQRELLQGEVLERQASYWKSQLAGAPTLLELPTDRPRPHLQTSRGAILRRELSPELTQKLKALGQQEEATPFMTLLAAFQALLSRYSGQDQILVGTPIANRTQPEMEGLIGFFLNTLVLRGDLSGDPNFREFLRRVRETALGAYAHQDLPFEKLVEELSPERSLSHSPLFQVLFIFQNAPRGTDDLDGLKVEALQSEGVTAKFDLNLIIAPEGNGLRVSLEYNTDLFDGDRIERMLGHFQTLLQAIVADPDREISRLPLLTETEKQQILVAWNQTQQDFPTRPCLHQLIQEQAQRTPEAIAAQFEHQQLTYQELNHRANQLAHFLQEQGIGPEQMVGLCVERSLEMLVGMLGILKAGAAYLPLDPAYPQERLAFLLEDAQAPLLITKSPLREHFPAYQGQRFCLDTEGHLLDPYPADTPVSNVTADNLAYLIYTSGSTGRPKGVAIAHASATRLLQWA